MKAPVFLGTVLVAAISLSCSMADSAAREADSRIEELIQVSVRGTNIDKLPSAVDVVTDDPERDSNRLLNIGAERDFVTQFHTVVYRGIPHNFVPLEYLDELFPGHGFSLSDVIYRYYGFASTDEVDAFADKFGLRVARVVDEEIIYGSQPGYYVRLIAPEVVYYTCFEHPDVKSDEEGQCPICQRDLRPVERHRP